MKSATLIFILALITISCCTDVKVPGICLGFDADGEQAFCAANVSKSQCYMYGINDSSLTYEWEYSLATGCLPPPAHPPTD